MASTVDKYSEAEGVVETVIKIFSERADPNTAREAGRDIADLKRRVTERHQEMIKSIRGERRAHVGLDEARTRTPPPHSARHQPLPSFPLMPTELSGQADRARRQLNERRQASDGSSAKEEMLTTKSRLDQSITRMRQENISLQQNIGAFHPTSPTRTHMWVGRTCQTHACGSAECRLHTRMTVRVASLCYRGGGDTSVRALGARANRAAAGSG